MSQTVASEPEPAVDPAPLGLGAATGLADATSLIAEEPLAEVLQADVDLASPLGVPDTAVRDAADMPAPTPTIPLSRPGVNLADLGEDIEVPDIDLVAAAPSQQGDTPAAPADSLGEDPMFAGLGEWLGGEADSALDAADPLAIPGLELVLSDPL